MLLRKISLKGFLSYYGLDNGNGQIAPIEIDLSDGALWLIYGENGAGKSSIFDAITFALYKKHRGGGQNFSRLINDAASEAELSLEIDLLGQRYLIQRTISERRTWGIVRRCPGKDKPYAEWPAEKNTENNVEAWVETNLRMSFETFTSTVVLLQGEADAFLKAKPSQRKTCLLELLDLQFYEDLGKKATQQKSNCDRQYKDAENELPKIDNITEQELFDQEQQLEKAQQQLLESEQLFATKEKELNNARRYQKLSQAIRENEEQLAVDAQLLEQENSIRAAVERHRELQDALRTLRDLWRTKENLTVTENKIQTKLSELQEIENDLADITVQFQQAQLDETRYTQDAANKNGELKQAEERKRELKQNLDRLSQRERIEEQIAIQDRSLDPYRSLLDQASEIGKQQERYDELNKIVPLIKNYNEANEAVQQSNQKVETARRSLDECQQRLRTARDEAEILEKLVSNADKEKEHTTSELSKLDSKLIVLQDKLAARQRVLKESECPTCGSPLHDLSVQQRLSDEQEQWQKEIDVIQEKQHQLDDELKNKKGQQAAIQDKLKSANKLIQQLEVDSKGYEKDVETHQRELAKSKEMEAKAIEDMGDSISLIGQLGTLESEMRSLTYISQKSVELQRAKQKEQSTHAVIQALRSQLHDLPEFSSEQRIQVKAEYAESERFVSMIEKQEENAKVLANEATNRRQSLENERYQVETDQKLAQNNLEHLYRDQEATNQEVIHQLERLPSGWHAHPACTDKASLATLEEEAKALEGNKTKEAALREALRRRDELTGSIKTLRQQQNEIPVEHQRAVADVEQEWTTVDQQKRSVEELVASTQDQLSKLRTQEQIYRTAIQKRDTAQKELGYFKKLADALGRKGLQAKIIQAAQESIKRNANETLARLSNGVWQIELEDRNGDELEILARDTSQPGTPSRPFEYISGGEKFRVAISLAVAIGQSISGGRTVDTLIIDEGFGSLDELNRDLLVDELRRLSDNVLSGGRVVVVSHQEDVCEKFGNRYHISKQKNGGVTAERYLHN